MAARLIGQPVVGIDVPNIFVRIEDSRANIAGEARAIIDKRRLILELGPRTAAQFVIVRSRS